MAISMGAALLGSAVIGAGASFLGGKSQKKAANKVANIEAQNNAANNALIRENRDLITGKIDPYNQIGLQNSQRINTLLAGGPYNGGALDSKFLDIMNPGSFENFRDSTGYKFRLGEGLEGLQQHYAIGPGLDNGAVQKDILKYSQNLASDEYGKYMGLLDRYGTYADQFANQERGYKTDQHYNFLNSLVGQQGVGLSAVNALAGVGTNATNALVQSNSQNAAAQGNAALAKGAATGQMYAGIGNALGTAAGYFVNPLLQPYNPYGGSLGAIY